MEKVEGVLYMDGFDDCLAGHVTRCGSPTLALYDTDKIIDKLINRDGMTYGEAVDYMEFNQIGAWVGEQTPMFLIEGES